MEDFASIDNSHTIDRANISNGVKEDSPLIQRNLKRVNCRKNLFKKMCISSKAGIMILFMSFIVCLLYHLLLNPDVYVGQTASISNVLIILMYSGLGLRAVVLLFYPLAGLFGDIKCGRFKVINTSLYLILISTAMAPLIFVLWVLVMAIDNAADLYSILVGMTILATVLLVCIMYIALMIFLANAIQFGLDQLYDSPAQDSSLFIHWYVWIYYISILFVELALTMLSYDAYSFLFDWPYTWHGILGISMLVIISLASIPLIGLFLCLMRHKKRWFLIEPGKLVNPYKLVYKITRFTLRHKIPVRCSAFTYCEDEIPSRLDLGKEKYGGPYVTEEVEDVKVFYGILKILFALGPVFILEIPSSTLLPLYTLHWSNGYLAFNPFGNITEGYFNQQFYKTLLISNGMLTPLVVTISIPLYMCFIRPYFTNVVPGMLKRIGTGFFISLLSLISLAIMDVFGNKNALENIDGISYCMFQEVDTEIFYNLTTSTPSPPQDVSLLLIPLIFAALSQMLIYIAMYEFICAQSPHSMKGLLIGLSFTVKGLYQLIAMIVTAPFTSWQYSFPSCEFSYYCTNIVIGSITFIIFILIAKRYKY